MVIYVLDTNSFIDLSLHYSIDTFPSVWNKFESLVDSKRIISPRQVFKEIGNSHTILTPWCKDHKSIFQNDDQIYSIAADIMKKFPNLVNKDNTKDPADPYLIALALMKQESPTDKSIIITQETSKKPNSFPKKPSDIEKVKRKYKKIPDVAEEYGISSVNLVGFFRNEKWTF